jgi:prepilin-type N-terminal cleavage/methylation domain-containing protein
VNNLRFKKSGFTIIEIIIVMVILSTLIAIAIPNIFSQVPRQNIQEAVNTLTLIRNAMELCGVQNGNDFTGCTFSTIDMSDPSYHSTNNPGAKFTYVISAQTNAGVYRLQATRENVSNDWIRWDRSTTGMTCTDNGIFDGYC